MHTHRHFAAAVAVATAAATTACAPTDPAPEAAAPPPVEVTDRHKLPTADSLDVDMGNPDAVAKAFVEVVESHDAGSDSTEWISVKRADSLMTPQARETYLSYTDGGVDTDWDVWRDAKAITHPAVSLHDAPKPKDTPTTAYRVVLAQLNVQPDDPAAAERLPKRMRVHFVTMDKTDGKWQVSIWKPDQLTDNTQPQAGEKTGGHQ